jgi:uncharacterized RmlC-like cupin family protein
MLITGEGKSRSTIRIIRPDQLNPETLQVPGSQRLSTISAAHGVAEPNAKAGIHRHGEQDTMGFVLEGKAMVRWGGCGEYRAEVRRRDLLHVPSWLPLQELNPSTTTPFRSVVVRSAPEPIPVKPSNDLWERQGNNTDEPGLSE